jgi:predicted nucleic acid-binding protein
MDGHSLRIKHTFKVCLINGGLPNAKAVYQKRTYLIMESDKELAEALERFARQPASVSFTDCIVMAVADRLGTQTIFGFDEVFRKNGYRLPGAPHQQAA